LQISRKRWWHHKSSGGVTTRKLRDRNALVKRNFCHKNEEDFYHLVFSCVKKATQALIRPGRLRVSK